MFFQTICSVLIQTEAEFQAIAGKLKPHVEGRMKIEPFPWLRDYYVELYTKLTLEKIKTSLFGEKFTSILHYEEMFERGSNSDRETEKEYLEDGGYLQINRSQRDKILLKGDPGMGKTTLGKKMGLDWAEGLFEKYSIVFFVHLKFVKPGDSIESAIIQQHTELRGLKVSEGKLRAMLERFGDRCLLILDGLDERGLGKNQEVLKIIENEMLLNCGIVVSSRPHSINQVQIQLSELKGLQKMRLQSSFLIFSQTERKFRRYWNSSLQIQGKISLCTNVQFYSQFCVFLSKKSKQIC